MQTDGVDKKDFDKPSKGGSVLIQSIFGGIVAGTAASVLALSLGHSIWIALLCHSIFGALGMGLVLVWGAGRTETQKRKPATKPVSAPVGTVRH